MLNMRHVQLNSLFHHPLNKDEEHSLKHSFARQNNLINKKKRKKKETVLLRFCLHIQSVYRIAFH